MEEETKTNATNIAEEEAEKVRDFFAPLKSVTVAFGDKPDEYDVYVFCVRYRHGVNGATSAQVDMIANYLSNVHCQSKSNVMKLNKWAASKIIDFAKNQGQKYSIYVKC